MGVLIPVLIPLMCLASAGQIPSNEARGSKLQTCASERERLVTPAVHAVDCRLNVGDAVNIDAGESCEWPVSIAPDGTIMLPLIGKLQAADLTTSQLTASITTLLGKFVNHPMVRVTLADGKRQTRYFVEGNVLRPGRYLLVTPVTVRETIEKAGGFKRTGHNREIRVLREGGSLLKLDYEHLLKNPEQNFAVQNGDHIFLR